MLGEEFAGSCRQQFAEHNAGFEPSNLQTIILFYMLIDSVVLQMPDIYSNIISLVNSAPGIGTTSQGKCWGSRGMGQELIYKICD